MYSNMRNNVQAHAYQLMYEHTRSDVQYTTSTHKPTVAVQKIHTWCTWISECNVSRVLPARQAREWHTRKSGLVRHTREWQLVL